MREKRCKQPSNFRSVETYQLAKYMEMADKYTADCPMCDGGRPCDYCGGYGIISVFLFPYYGLDLCVAVLNTRNVMLQMQGVKL